VKILRPSVCTLIVLLVIPFLALRTLFLTFYEVDAEDQGRLRW
jgi:hypothetical protein